MLWNARIPTLITFMLLAFTTWKDSLKRLPKCCKLHHCKTTSSYVMTLISARKKFCIDRDTLQMLFSQKTFNWNKSFHFSWKAYSKHPLKDRCSFADFFPPEILTRRVTSSVKVRLSSDFFLKIDFLSFLLLLSWRVSKIWDKHFHVFTHAVPYVRITYFFVHLYLPSEGEERQGGKNRRLFKSVTCTILKAIDIR